jgi:hypothetical protein
MLAKVPRDRRLRTAPVVILGYTALDEETGEEVERVEALPCRRCLEDGVNAVDY